MFTLSPTHAQYGPSSNPLQTASMSGISRMSIPDTATDCVHHSTSNVWPPLFCCSGLTAAALCVVAVSLVPHECAWWTRNEQSYQCFSCST